MASRETGGAALAIGIWYQSLGAAATLTPHWDFRHGVSPNIDGEALELYQSEPLEVLLEYFDMDLAITDYSGKWFVQFKVTGQRPPKPFARNEVREGLGNATQAILRHEHPPPNRLAVLLWQAIDPLGSFC